MNNNMKNNLKNNDVPTKSTIASNRNELNDIELNSNESNDEKINDKNSNKKRGDIDICDFTTHIFDLYGTLINIHTDEHSDETWEKFMKVLDEKGIKHPDMEQCREDHFRLDAEYRSRPSEYECPEIDILDVFSDMFVLYGNPKLDHETLYEVSSAFRVASRDFFELYPGVKEYLTMLHSEGKKIYILSNAQNSFTDPEIKALGLDKMVDDYLISSDYKCMKPDPAFWQFLFDKHHLNKENSVMYGDSYENDYLGAKNFGISAIWLNGKDKSEKFYLDHLIVK